MLKPIFGISLGSFPIYQVMLVIAFFAALFLLNGRLKKAAMSKTIKARARKSFCTAIVFGAIGANVANWFIHDEVMGYSIYDKITKGGFSFVFGMLAFFAAAAILLRLYKLDVPCFIDMFVPSVIIAELFARVGCSFVGCCYGKTIHVLGFSFLFPVRELEILFALIMLIVLLRRGQGKRLPIYLFGFGIFRFLVDFGRGDDRGSLFGISAISPTQMIAILLVVVGGVSLFGRRIVTFLKCEDTLEKGKATICKIKQKLKIKPYTPLPNHYVGPKPRFVALRVIAWFLVINIAITGVFVSVNPFGLGFINDIKYAANDVVGFLYEAKSQEIAMGETSASTLADVSEKPIITNEKAALQVVKETDSWFGGNLAFKEKKSLASGNTMYVFHQIVAGRAVLGKTRVLVVDHDDKPLYVAGDAAEFSFTGRVIDRYVSQPLTINKAFGKKARIVKEMPCLYETEKGLLKAKHVILADNTNKPVVGAVIQEKDGAIVRLTKPELGAISNEGRNEIDFAVAAVRREQEQKDTAENDRKPSDLEKALLSAKKKAKLTDEQFESVLSSSEEIVDAVPNASPEIFGKILAKETEQLILKENEDEKQAEKRAGKVEKAFKSRGIKNTDDEVAMAITSKAQKGTFKHEIGSAEDVDVFRVSTEGESGISLEIKTDKPIKAEICNETDFTVTVVYADKKETVKLYPEDGAYFTIKISGQISYSEEKGFGYSISTKDFEIENKPERAVDRILFTIENAYNRSNLALFASVLAVNGQPPKMEHILTAAAMPTVMESCGQCDTGCGQCGDISGINLITDIAKTTIVEELLRSSEDTEWRSNLKGSEMTLSYFSAKETERGTAVKARVCITMDSLVLYDSFTFFRIETLENELQQTEDESQVQDAYNFIVSNINEYITEFNTDALYHVFGDTANSIKSKSDLWSLYTLCETRISPNGLLETTHLNVAKAKKDNHSDEKIRDFQIYLAKQNINQTEYLIRTAQANARMYGALSVGATGGKMLYDAYTSPLQFLIDVWAEQQEWTDTAWDTISFMIDPAGEFVDIVIEESSKEFIQLADNYIVIAKEYQTELDILKKELAALTAK